MIELIVNAIRNLPLTVKKWKVDREETRVDNLRERGKWIAKVIFESLRFIRADYPLEIDGLLIEKADGVIVTQGDKKLLEAREISTHWYSCDSRAFNVIEFHNGEWVQKLTKLLRVAVREEEINQLNKKLGDLKNKYDEMKG
jgi:hypothetical protein